jgi:hypothetical protein
VTAAAPDATQAAPAIPFRETAEVSGGDVASALGWTLLLLALVAAFALLARRQGWLRRWGAVLPAPAVERMRVEQVLRVSARTTLFRIADGPRQYLLAESRDGVQLLPLPATPAGESPDGA